MARILVIDDDKLLLAALEQLLTDAGHAVTTANDGLEAARLFRTQPFEVILTDIVMPRREGIETIMELRREHPEIGVIAMSGGVPNSPSYLAVARSFGAHYTLAKPFSGQELELAITAVLQRGPTAPVGHARNAPPHGSTS